MLFPRLILSAQFQGIIILSLGYTGLQTTLMTMPSGACQLIGCVGASYFASRFKNLRIAMSLVFITPFLAGILGLHFLSDAHPWGRLVSLWLCFFFASPYGIGMSLVNANTAGHTKRTTTTALYIIGAGLGSFIGPFFFKAGQEPYYRLGFGMMFIAFALEVVVLVGLFAVLW
jgi:MFS transporter, ACS family, allantoate permease